MYGDGRGEAAANGESVLRSLHATGRASAEPLEARPPSGAGINRVFSWMRRTSKFPNFMYFRPSFIREEVQRRGEPRGIWATNSGEGERRPRWTPMVHGNQHHAVPPARVLHDARRPVELRRGPPTRSLRPPRKSTSRRSTRPRRSPTRSPSRPPRRSATRRTSPRPFYAAVQSQRLRGRKHHAGGVRRVRRGVRIGLHAGRIRKYFEQSGEATAADQRRSDAVRRRRRGQCRRRRFGFFGTARRGGEYTASSCGGSDEFVMKNDCKIQAILSAHRDEALTMFKADAPASRLVALRMDSLAAMKSSLDLLPSKLPPTNLLVNSEEEAMRLFRIVSAHRDKALAMFKADAPASRMVSLRMENLAAMKTAVASPRTLPSDLLVKSEEEAMRLFQEEGAIDSYFKIATGDSERGEDTNIGIVGKDTNIIRNVTSSEHKNDHVIEDGLSHHSAKPHSVKSPSNSVERNCPIDFGPSNQNTPELNSSTWPPKEHSAVSGEIPAVIDVALGRCRNKASVSTPQRPSMPSPTVPRLGELSDGSSCKQISFSPPETVATGDIAGQGSSMASEHSLLRVELRKGKDDAMFQSLKGSTRCSTGGYEAKIVHLRRVYSVGVYKLQSDAALAHDVCVRTLEGPTWKSVNFENEKAHRDLRAIELKKHGLSVDLEKTLAEISTKVNEVALRVSNRDYSKSSSVRAELQKGKDNAFQYLKGLSQNLSGVYRATIKHHQRCYFLGTYKLQSDAALAYDVCARALKGPTWKSVNFENEQAHRELRAIEQKKYDLSVDLEKTLAKISAKVNEITLKVSNGDYSKSSSVRAELEKGKDDAFQYLKGFRRESSGSYAATVRHLRRKYFVGTYKLQSDAALAYDVCVRDLKGPTWQSVNFENKQAHRDLRAIEQKKYGLSVDLEETLAKISAKVNEVALKVSNGGYSITDEALVATECNINEICSSENSVVILDSREQAIVEKEGKEACEGTSSTADDEESNVGSDDDGGLSPYERLRLWKIKRNQARLLQLGLLAKTADNVSAASIDSTSTNKLTSDKGTVTRPPQKNKKMAPFVRRSLPNRRCSAKFKEGFSYDDTSVDGDSNYRESFSASHTILEEKGATTVLKTEEDSLPSTEYSSTALRGLNINLEVDLDQNCKLHSLKGITRRCCGRYEAQIRHQNNKYMLGTYKLQSDAAFAYDSAARAMKGPTWKRLNFASKQEYIDIREKEMKSTGLDMNLEEALAAISTKVNMVEASIVGESNENHLSTAPEIDNSTNTGLASDRILRAIPITLRRKRKRTSN